MSQPEPTLPVTTLVFFYLRNIAGVAIQGAQVVFTLNQSPNQYTDASSHVIAESVTVTTDSSGYGETNLIASSQFQPSAKTYGVTITFADGNTQTVLDPVNGTPIAITVPDSGPVDLTSLLTAV